MEASTVLRLKGLTKRFGSILANDDITIELQKGEVLALLGENGAGKTCLLYTSPSPRDRTRSRMPSSA